MDIELKELNQLKSRLESEIAARKEAQRLSEVKTLELYKSNASLTKSMKKATKNTARLNAIMNSIQDCVIVTDLFFNIRDGNAATEKTFGMLRADFLDKSVFDFVHENDKAAYQTHCEYFIRGKLSEEDAAHHQFSFAGSNGKPLCVEATISMFSHDDQEYVLHILRDMTIRKQLQDDLAHATKWEAVGHLAGGIAHEINTPSQYISDNLRFLNQSVSDIFSILEQTLLLNTACKHEKIFEDMTAAIDKLIEINDLDFLIEETPMALSQSLDGIAQVSRIVLAMKDFSHPGSKEKQAVDLSNTIETVLTVSRNEWKNIAKVDLDLDLSLSNVECLPGDINQTLLNIIVNAAHAIEETGRNDGLITITTRAIDQFVEIRITDNGNGIKEENRDSIFNPFFTTKEVGKGTGQGLSLAHDVIVKKHQGQISFETEYGVGTTFIIQLPYQNNKRQQFA